MKVYTIKCFDSYEYRTINLDSFLNKDDAERALKYYEDSSDHEDYEDYEISVTKIYENFEGFIKDEEYWI